MASANKLNEQELVGLRHQAIQTRFIHRRKWSMIYAISTLLLCMLLFALGRWALSVSCLFISLIAFSAFFTANGHLQHIQKRGESRKRLSRDFSVLDPRQPTDDRVREKQVR